MRKKRKKSKTSIGKKFEKQVKEDIEKLPNVFIYRLKDTMSRRKGDSNICDFLSFKKPKLYALECKTVKTGTISYNEIRDNQWNGLLAASTIPGIIAGYLIWFRKLDTTIFINAVDLAKYRETHLPSKSFNFLKMLEENNNTKNYLDRTPFIYIPGKKKRVLFKYDFKSLFR